MAPTFPNPPAEELNFFISNNPDFVNYLNQLPRSTLISHGYAVECHFQKCFDALDQAFIALHRRRPPILQFQTAIQTLNPLLSVIPTALPKSDLDARIEVYLQQRRFPSHLEPFIKAKPFPDQSRQEPID